MKDQNLQEQQRPEDPKTYSNGLRKASPTINRFAVHQAAPLVWPFISENPFEREREGEREKEIMYYFCEIHILHFILIKKNYFLFQSSKSNTSLGHLSKLDRLIQTYSFGWSFFLG